MRFESVTIAAGEKSTLQIATSDEQARLQGAAVLPREAGAALQCAMLCVAVAPDAARAPPITPAIWRGRVSAPHYVGGLHISALTPSHGLAPRPSATLLARSSPWPSSPY